MPLTGDREALRRFSRLIFSGLLLLAVSIVPSFALCILAYFEKIRNFDKTRKRWLTSVEYITRSVFGFELGHFLPWISLRQFIAESTSLYYEWL